MPAEGRRTLRFTAVGMGNPHCVVRVDDVDACPVAVYGPTIETHPLFPQRTNVEFVQVVGRNEVKMRVWERGVGETLACGTGASAVTVACVLNGKTDRELTVYYVKVTRPHLDLALDVLVDLVRNPLLDPSEFEKERRVVLEELAMVADSPPQLTDLLLDATLWPDQPLGRDVAGTPESVSALTPQMATEYLHRQYVANNVVVALAGDIDHQRTVDAIWPAMGDWEAGAPSLWFPASDGGGPRCGLRYKKTEQAHMEIAVRGLPLKLYPGAAPPKAPVFERAGRF